MSADMDFILGSEKLKTYFQYHWNLMPDIKPDINSCCFVSKFVQNDYLDNPVKLWSQGQCWKSCCILFKIVDGSELSFSLSLTQQKQFLGSQGNIVSILSYVAQSGWVTFTCFYQFQLMSWMWSGLARNPPLCTNLLYIIEVLESELWMAYLQTDPYVWKLSW